MGGMASNFASGMSSSNAQKKDSMQARSYITDSVKVSYFLLGGQERFALDTNIGNISNRLNLPKHSVPICNDGGAVLNYLYKPSASFGWNKGSDLFDSLLFTEKNIKIYRSTFPYSKLGYVFGSNEMQGLNFLYAQNINSQLNFGGEFKSFSSPGFFKSQNTFNYSYYLYTQFESINKTYQITAALINNQAQASINGGVRIPDIIRNSNEAVFFDRENVPVYFNNSKTFTTNIYNNQLDVGNQFRQRTIYVTQLLRFGKLKPLKIIEKKDTFLHSYKIPKVTIAYTFKNDVINTLYIHNTLSQDSAYYQDFMPILKYQLNTYRLTKLSLQEGWNNFTNQLTLTFYPDLKKKNTENFISSSIALIKNSKSGSGNLGDSIEKITSEYNLHVDAKWQYQLDNHWNVSTQFDWYQFGISGQPIHPSSETNTSVIAFLKGIFTKHNYSLKLFYTKNNQGFFTSTNSIFYIDTTLRTFAPEQKIHASASISLFKKWHVNAQTTFINNVVYYTNYETPSIYKNWLSITQLSLQKEFHLGKYFHWTSEFYYQPNYFINATQKIGDFLPYPEFWTYQRFAFTKKLYGKSTFSIGIILKYNSPYYAPNFSPAIGKTVIQKDTIVTNYPIVNAFITLKIRGFHLYWEMENINTVTFKNNALNYVRNNFATPFYPTNELNYKVGIYWDLVN